jgi:glutamate/tyrosine decarboxylase-like PLP-dependent enzyme
MSHPRDAQRDGEATADLLRETLAAALDYLATVDDRPAAVDFTPAPPGTLPEAGLGAQATLRQFLARFGADWPASNGPRFWGFVTGGTTPAALAGDWLASAYDLNLSSAAHLVRELLGLPANFHGTFVSGATMSNFVGLALGREWVARRHGTSVAQAGLHAMPPFPVLSGAAHSSVYKALAMLGLGRASLRTVALQPGNREAVDVAALRRELARLDGAPCIVVANAGTVNTVDFDDLGAVAELQREFPFWLHVDGAFGAFAACAPRFRRLVAGIESADSLTVDAHKWLNVPYDSGLIFTRHRDLQLAVFRNSAAYLGELGDPPDFVHLAPENSRRLRALPAWFTLQAYGRRGYQEIVERTCELAQALGARIAASAEFRLLAPVRLNVVCFTLAGAMTAERVQGFLARLRADGRVFLTPTVYQGVPAIRAAFSNWRTQETDLDSAWQAMRSCL